jgi:hypothetical protein
MTHPIDPLSAFLLGFLAGLVYVGIVRLVVDWYVN